MQISFEPQQALKVINEAKSLAVVTAPAVSAETLCAMLAFYHTFKDFKKIRLIAPEAVPEVCFNLPESSVIEKDLGPKKLGINLDTNGVALEKVTYSMEGKTFKLVLHPQRRAFDVERISYENLGFNFDLFVFFGLKQIGQVAPLFNYDLSEVYKNVSLNFDVGLGNERFASVNLVDENGSSICDHLFKVLGYWGIKFPREASLCLLTGLVNLMGTSSEEISPELPNKDRSSASVRPSSPRLEADRDGSPTNRETLPSPEI